MQQSNCYRRRSLAFDLSETKLQVKFTEFQRQSNANIEHKRDLIEIKEKNKKDNNNKKRKDKQKETKTQQQKL